MGERQRVRNKQSEKEREEGREKEGRAHMRGDV